MIINITPILKATIHIGPTLAVGMTLGYMLANIRSEFWQKFFTLENRVFENMTNNLKMFATVSEAISHCMKKDRFEIVDITKEGKDAHAK